MNSGVRSGPATAGRLAACGLLLVVAVSAPGAELSVPHEIAAHYRNGDRFMGIRLLGSLRLKSGPLDGHTLTELSGLAWDEDERILYAVSDGGSLFHFRPRFEGDMLTGLEGLAAYRLENPEGRALTGVRADAEGLALENGANGLRGDSRLTVSFERRPRLVTFTPEGRHLITIPLPDALTDISRYASPNRSLESVAQHPALGWLTAPELPMAGQSAGIIPIWSARGEHWNYPLRDVPNNALVAMEALEDGSLVTLERGHGRFYTPLIISLRRTAPLSAGKPLKSDDVATVAVFDSSAGWRIDNFEGLTRHRGRRFFLSSDDNTNSVQVTLLLYVEIVDPQLKDYRVLESDTRQENLR